MPPKRAAKRKAAAATEVDSSAKKRVKPDSKAETSTASGLLLLPENVFNIILDELLDPSQLISHERVLANDTHVEKEFQYRTDVLRGLTQASRALRQLCLPKYYEHVEVCIVRGKGAWYKQLGDRLEKTSLMLAKYPELAGHVRTVTVTLTRYSTDVVLPAFAACLKLLPNLHTIRVMHAHSQMTTPLKKAFEKIVLPQVRTVMLPGCAHNVLRSCPNAVSVTCVDVDGTKLVTAITKLSQKVEILGGLFSFEDAAKRLKKAAPKLREIHLYNNRRISSLAELKGITTLHLDIHIDSRAEADIPNDIASALATPPPVVEDAKRYLSESKSDSPKFLKVIYKVHDFELEERWKDVYHRPQRWKVASVQDFEL